ncbi:hypothetical protein KXD40_005143 [Peronospora effusa]|nr:hypothetical protein KXD40_005143 [Peronospora effusa]
MKTLMNAYSLSLPLAVLNDEDMNDEIEYIIRGRKRRWTETGAFVRCAAAAGWNGASLLHYEWKATLSNDPGGSSFAELSHSASLYRQL